jgi:hypothetical protein
MCDRVRASATLHADDTPVPLLAPRRTAYTWVYVGDAANPYTVFDLTAGRSQGFPAAFLAGFTGFLQGDGYAGYHSVITGGATGVGCWAHARRYFFDARLSDQERSHDALARIRALYAVEREAKDKKLTGADLAASRQRHAGPVLAAFADWLTEQRPRVLPKSAIGEAVTYASNQWPTLGVYLADGRLTCCRTGGTDARSVWLLSAVDAVSTNRRARRRACRPPARTRTGGRCGHGRREGPHRPWLWPLGQSSFTTVPMPRFLVDSELLLLPNRSR